MMRRAVFSELQRRGLERRFQIQKYISKPERKKLAEKLGLKDSQVRLNNNLNLIDSSRCLFIDLISTPPPPPPPSFDCFVPFTRLSHCPA